jgi:ribosomal protein L20A (L18A)
MQTGIEEPNNLKVYGLRSFNPSERLELIEHAIYNTPNVGLVVIDGIKDLVTSINSEEEATMISSKLLKWTEEKNIHIINVLHQNKTSDHARGHIGTELINKAETVLSVNVDEKDKDISIMTAEQTRNKEPNPFAFRIDENGIPTEVVGYCFTKEIASGRRNYLLELNETHQYEIIESAFIRLAERSKLNREERFEVGIGYGDLIQDIKYLTKEIHNESVGDNKVKNFITEMKHKGYLIQEKERKPYFLIPYKEVSET